MELFMSSTQLFKDRYINMQTFLCAIINILAVNLILFQYIPIVKILQLGGKPGYKEIYIRSRMYSYSAEYNK